jgi:hypothetical protein
MPDTKGLYTSILRLVIQLVILAIVNWLLTELPMIKAITIPGLPVTLTSIISFIIGWIAIGVILVFRRDFIPRLRSNYPNFPQASTIVSEGITLVIIIIAYTMFDGSIRPLMKQLAWLYPVIFLAIALWPLYMLITTLYRSSGPIADWTSTKISATPPPATENARKCAGCGKVSPAPAKFCTSCGAAMGDPACGSKCSKCGAVNNQQDKYCMNCGAPADENDQFDTRVSV